MISHWDDVEGVRRERGHIAGEWQALTGEASLWLGVQRIRVDPDRWSTPLHLEGSEEEIFFVLGGDGVSLLWDGEAETAHAVGVGDCLVHRALEQGHTLRAGSQGIEVLAFGERHYAANTLLPRADVSWLGPTWVRRGSPDDHPWAREAAAGPPTVGDLAPRPPTIVNVDDVPLATRSGTTVARSVRAVGRAAGSLKTGLNLYDVEPGRLMNPPHCHSEEEEIYVVLAGTGTLEVWPHARSVDGDDWPAERARHPLRAGSVVASPAGTGRPLSFEAGPDGLRVLVYGMRRPGDVCFYPRSGKVSLRGVGVIGRIEQLSYWEGED